MNGILFAAAAIAMIACGSRSASLRTRSMMERLAAVLLATLLVGMALRRDVLEAAWLATGAVALLGTALPFRPFAEAACGVLVLVVSGAIVARLTTRWYAPQKRARHDGDR